MNIYLFFTFLFLFSLNINFLVHSVCIKHRNMHKKMCNLTTWFHNKNAWRKKMHHQTLMRLHMLCAVCQRKIFFWSSNLCTVIAFYKLIIAMFYILLICPILTDLFYFFYSVFLRSSQNSNLFDCFTFIHHIFRMSFDLSSHFCLVHIDTM